MQDTVVMDCFFEQAECQLKTLRNQVYRMRSQAVATLESLEAQPGTANWVLDAQLAEVERLEQLQGCLEDAMDYCCELGF